MGEPAEVGDWVPDPFTAVLDPATVASVVVESFVFDPLVETVDWVTVVFFCSSSFFAGTIADRHTTARIKYE